MPRLIRRAAHFTGDKMACEAGLVKQGASSVSMFSRNVLGASGPITRGTLAGLRLLTIDEFAIQKGIVRRQWSSSRAERACSAVL